MSITEKNPFPLVLLAILLAGAGTAGAHVSLVYPTGGEMLVAGSRITIEWQEVIAHDTQNWDLYWSPDGGATWVPLQLDIPFASRTFEWDVPAAATTTGRIRVVQDNTGVDYEASSGNLVIEAVGTAVEDGTDLPGAPLLVQGYPNPFSGAVGLTVSVPRAGRVKAEVYDVLGNRVASLVDAEVPAGRLLLKWSADGLPPGLYLARVVQSGQTATLSLVLAR